MKVYTQNTSFDIISFNESINYDPINGKRTKELRMEFQDTDGIQSTLLEDLDAVFSTNPLGYITIKDDYEMALLNTDEYSQLRRIIRMYSPDRGVIIRVNLEVPNEDTQSA